MSNTSSLFTRKVSVGRCAGSSGFLRLCRDAFCIGKSLSGTVVCVAAFLKGTVPCPLARDVAEGEKGCPLCPCTQVEQGL